jgi:hypothetical protein
MTIGRLKIGPIFMSFHFSYYYFLIQQPFACRLLGRQIIRFYSS